MDRLVVVPWALALLALPVCAFAAGSTSAKSVILPELSPVRDGGFEEASGSALGPAWKFTLTGDVQATAVIDREVRHSGAQSLRLSSPGGREGNPAAWIVQTLAVLPATTYRFSVWVKGEDVGDHNEINDDGPDDFWLDLPAGTYGWAKLEKRLTTAPDQTTLTLRIELRMPTTAMWLDDLSLEAEVTRLSGKRPDIVGGFWAPSVVEGDDASGKASLLIAAPSAFDGQASLSVIAEGQVIGRTSAPLSGGKAHLLLDWNSGAAPVSQLALRLDIKDASGTVVATAERTVEKISSSRVLAELAKVEQAVPALRSAIDSLAVRGVAVDYPRISLTILEHFIPWNKEDVARGEVRRASYAADDLTETLARAQAEVAALEADPKSAPLVTRYHTGPVQIDGTHFVSDLVRSDGTQARGPVFFTGYGHFGQVVTDLPLFPDYGINVIQIEFGPNSVLTAEDQVSYDNIRRIQAALDRAAQNNVAVCLLLSPHYFPGWALEKWPDLSLCQGGFLHYCVDAPESRAVIEKFLRIAIPELRGRPALQSLCLSNEPIYTDTAKCPVTRRMWAQWLAREHGDIAMLNRRLGTNYASFDEVPIPGNHDFDAAQFTEWILFNDERFAGWHKWMADIIHEMAPEIPVHAKIMAWTTNSQRSIADGVDPELFGAMGQISGNDCSESYPGSDEWAMGWQLQNWFYDLQRTACHEPVFNTENHLTPDRSTHYVPGVYFRAALWQGAVHGQGGSTTWVWERTYDRKSDFYGNVMHRPGCAEQTGRVGLDLLRLAPEVAALQSAPAPVAFLYSRTAGSRSETYWTMMQNLYEALNFTGVPIGFVTDRMAARGEFGATRVLILTGATHMPDDAVAGIAGFVERGGKLMIVGRDNLRYDRFGRERAAADVKALLADAIVLNDRLIRSSRGQPTPLYAELVSLMTRLGFVSDLRLADGKGRAPWGVEFRVAKVGKRQVLNAVNYLKTPQQVTLTQNGKPARARDLISRKALGPNITLSPMEPVLLEAEG
jgi:hypothetical protein